jgi:hypothetical protein
VAADSFIVALRERAQTVAGMLRYASRRGCIVCRSERPMCRECRGGGE